MLVFFRNYKTQMDCNTSLRITIFCNLFNINIYTIKIFKYMKAYGRYEVILLCFVLR